MEDEIFEKTKSKARDLLMCSLCSSTYINPRRLPCDHSFCRRCLQAYHDSIPNEGSVRLGSFHCPTCSAQIGIPFGGVSYFPFDERIHDIKEKVVEEMEDILLKKLHATKGKTDTGSLPDFSNTKSENANSFNQRGTRSHETDPPMNQGKSRSFARGYQSTAFDSHQMKSELPSNSPSSRSRFDRHRPTYSSLRETHRRKAQDLLAAFDPQLRGSSQTDDVLSSGSSTSKETYYNASSDHRSFNNSSRFKTHHKEDLPHRFFSGNSRSSFNSSESARTSGDGSAGTNSSSASGYFGDRNSTFLRNHRGYESLREKSNRRTYLGEDTFSYFAAPGKTTGESKFQETQTNVRGLHGRYAQETKTRSDPLVESYSPPEAVAAWKTASENCKPESVSDPSCLNHTKKDHVDLDDLEDGQCTDFERPAETVGHMSDDQNGTIPESLSMSQPSFRRNEKFTRLKKPASDRTKLLGAFISSLATAHEECAPGDKMPFEESPPSNGTKSRLRCPPDITNTFTPNIKAPADLISNSSNIKSGIYSKVTLGGAVDKLAKVSGKVPLENFNNCRSIDEEEVMQEFDFLVDQLNEDEEIGIDSNGSESTESIINKTNLPDQHRGKSRCTTATTLLADVSQQCMNDTEVDNSADIADRLISKNGFDENGFRASHRSGGGTHPGNGVESRNGLGGDCSSGSTDRLPSAGLFGNDGKVKEVASGGNISSLHENDSTRLRNGSDLSDAAGDDADDNDDSDTLVNEKASEVENNSFNQTPTVPPCVPPPVMSDKVKTAGQTRGLRRRVTRQKRTINEGTATLHHVSPEVYLMPTGVAILSQGSTVVADYGLGCLQYYADDGSPLHRIEGMKPFSIAVNSANNQVIVGDRRRKTVCLFDECGCDVAEWDANMFGWICGIGILCDGDLVILDREKSQIGIYKANGQRVRTFGSYGSDDSQLCMAEFLVVDRNDRIVVSDSGNHCIKVFSVAGTLLLKFGRRGFNDGEMQWPKGICTDELNNIIVADTCNSRVSMFSSDGCFVQHLVTNITMPYAVSYSHPNVAVTRYAVMGQSQFLLYSIGDKS